jgi:hypothetical protein
MPKTLPGVRFALDRIAISSWLWSGATGSSQRRRGATAFGPHAEKAQQTRSKESRTRPDRNIGAGLVSAVAGVMLQIVEWIAP